MGKEQISWEELNEGVGKHLGEKKLAVPATGALGWVGGKILVGLIDMAVGASKETINLEKPVEVLGVRNGEVTLRQFDNKPFTIKSPQLEQAVIDELERKNPGLKAFFAGGAVKEIVPPLRDIPDEGDLERMPIPGDKDESGNQIP